jgi:hypothetical protein
VIPYEQVGGRCDGILVDRAVACRSAMSCTEFVRALLVGKSSAHHISVGFPVSVGLSRCHRLGQALLDIGEARRATASFPNTKPRPPAAVGTDLDTLFCCQGNICCDERDNTHTLR